MTDRLVESHDDLAAGVVEPFEQHTTAAAGCQ